MKKKILGLVLGLFLLVGCGGGSSSSDGEAVGMSISTLSNPFFVTIKESAEKQAKESNVALEVLDAKDDVAKQTSDIETLVNKGVKVIIVNPVESSAVKPAIEAAIAKDVKIITVDRSAEGVEVTTHIASDNVAGGKLAGDYLIKKLDGKGKVIELEGRTGASATIERGKGFNEAVKGKLDVIAKQTAEFDRNKGMTVMENLAQANKEFDAVFAHNDEMILGALQAIKNDKVITVGFDGNDDALKSIESGELNATVIQQPDIMGVEAIKVAAKIIAGEKVEKTIPVDLVLVDKDNVADFLK
ncbi:ribose transport system substrate-binding protein [Bacilli bacterium PM5-3]|nr:ribose transport system substrate-binding protein [Bacilli bacterium PM5-3]MDH6604289.1 ribose transport system substrate-binding protein [Bacilli bacterium PM5-9]